MNSLFEELGGCALYSSSWALVFRGGVRISSTQSVIARPRLLRSW